MAPRMARGENSVVRFPNKYLVHLVADKGSSRTSVANLEYFDIEELLKSKHVVLNKKG